MQEFPKALDALHANSPRGRSVPVEPDLFGKLAPRQGTREAMGKQWQNLPMPNNRSHAPNVGAGYTVSISAPHDTPELMKSSGGKYLPSISEKRLSVDSKLFGTPRDAQPDKRPVYGYLRPDNMPAPIDMYTYGRMLDDQGRVRRAPGLNLNVKPQALSGATTSDHDTYAHSASAEPLNPSHQPKFIHSYGKDSAGYREVQMHNGVGLSDIKDIDIVSPSEGAKVSEEGDDVASVTKRNEDVANRVRRETGIPVNHIVQRYQPSLFEGQHRLEDVGRGEWVNDVISKGNTPTR